MFRRVYSVQVSNTAVQSTTPAWWCQSQSWTATRTPSSVRTGPSAAGTGSALRQQAMETPSADRTDRVPPSWMDLSSDVGTPSVRDLTSSLKDLITQKSRAVRSVKWTSVQFQGQTPIKDWRTNLWCLPQDNNNRLKHPDSFKQPPLMICVRIFRLLRTF